MKIILLIDDDEQIRKSFGPALRHHGYRVIEADNGVTGLELARLQMPDLILTDINMPGGNGQALLHQIRVDSELSSKQVVLMTGRPDMVTPRRGMEEGADDFLVKPISREALLSCMEARLRRADIHWRVEDRMISRLSQSLTSILPHEFFTPLAGILGLTEILAIDSSGFTSKEMAEFHRDIHQAALRLHRTLRNYVLILELQTDAKAHEWPPVPLPAGEVQRCLDDALDLVNERFSRADDVTLHCEKCPLLVSSSDLVLIAEELLDNALKFSRPGTPVTLRLRKDGILSVTDRGRGMTQAEIDQIGAFRQFERQKNEQQGLGLGLNLIQKLAARNNVKVSVASEIELGVEVCFHFRHASICVEEKN